MKEALNFIDKHSQEIWLGGGIKSMPVIDADRAKVAVKMAYEAGYKKGYTEGAPTQDEIEEIENEVMRNRI